MFFNLKSEFVKESNIDLMIDKTINFDDFIINNTTLEDLEKEAIKFLETLKEL